MNFRIGIFLGLLVLFQPASNHAETITLATGEWIPFTSAHLPEYGEFTKLVSTVIKEMDMEPKYRLYPWPRCYDSVIKGRVWAAFPYSYTAQRAKHVIYSDPVSCSKTVFFYYERGAAGDRYRYEGLEDLQNYRIGGVSGYFYSEIFKKNGLTVDYVSKEISGLEKLIAGRIDLMPLNELVGKHLIEANFPNDIGKFKTISKPLSVDSLHLIASKDSQRSVELMQRFNAALNRCVEKKLIKIPDCD
jgi:polar amino acid transport system substrate-binding protein